MSKSHSEILTEAATAFINASAGSWAGEIVGYVPGLVEAQLADLAKHGLSIEVRPPTVGTPPPPHKGDH